MYLFEDLIRPVASDLAVKVRKHLFETHFQIYDNFVLYFKAIVCNVTVFSCFSVDFTGKCKYCLKPSFRFMKPLRHSKAKLKNTKRFNCFHIQTTSDQVQAINYTCICQIWTLSERKKILFKPQFHNCDLCKTGQMFFFTGCK